MPENTWFLISLDSRRKKMALRIAHLHKSLSLLKQQDSDFAEGHRLLIAAYEDELATLDTHRNMHTAKAALAADAG